MLQLTHIYRIDVSYGTIVLKKHLQRKEVPQNKVINIKVILKVCQKQHIKHLFAN